MPRRKTISKSDTCKKPSKNSIRSLKDTPEFREWQKMQLKFSLQSISRKALTGAGVNFRKSEILRSSARRAVLSDSRGLKIKW